MKNQNRWLSRLVSDKSDTSSTRVINILGAVTGTILMLYHGIWLDTLTYDVFGVYLAYCGGAYVMGKYVNRKYERSEYESIDNDVERYKTYDNTESSTNDSVPMGNQHGYRK